MALRLATIIRKMATFRNPKEYQGYKVEILEVKAAPSKNTVYFKSGVFGENNIYQNYIQFFDVKFEPVEKETKTEGKAVLDVSGKKYAYGPIQADKSRVKMYCKCQDMGFTFSYQLFENDSYIGAFKRYKRVPGSTRPPRNPKNVPGFCKHIWSHLKQLEKNGVLTGV